MRLELLLLLCLFHVVYCTFTPVVTKYFPNTGSNNARTSFTDGTYGYFGTDDSIFKVELSTNNIVGTINLNSGETLVMVALMDGTTGYFGLQTDPGIIIKVDLSTFTRTATLTLNTGDTYMRSGFVVGDYLYFGTGVVAQSNRIIKIDKTTFTRSSALEYDTSYGGCLSGVTDGTFGYFSFDVSGSSSKIIKINLSTFTQAASLTLNDADDYPQSPVVADGNLYYGAWDSSSTPALTSAIVKINLSSFTRTTSISAPGNIMFSGISDGTYGYFGTTGASKDTFDSLVRLKYSDNTITQLALNVGEFSINTGFINSGTAYFGVGSSPASVVLVDTASFTRSSNFIFKTTANLGGVVADSSYFYFSTTQSATSYGFINKINRNTLALTDILALNYGEGNSKACFIEGTDAYFAAKTNTVTNPSVVVKVNLNTFTRTSVLTLSAPNVNSVVKVGDYAYYGSSTNPGRITKMQISTFSEVATISLNVTTAGQLVKNMDVALSDGTYGYFGSGGDNPGKVVQFDLATLSIVKVTTFGVGVTFVRSGTIFGTHAFYGTQSGHIVKILLSDLSVVSSTALDAGTINVNTANVLGSYIYFGNAGTTTLNATLYKFDPSATTYESYFTSTLYNLVPSYNDGSGTIYYGTNTYPAYIYKVIVDTVCQGAVGGALNSGDSRTVYSETSSCDTTCTGVQGTISCTNGVLSGDTTFQYTTCTPSGTYTCGCMDALGGELMSNNTRDVYSAASHCSTSCDPVKGEITCTNGVLSGDTSFTFSSCTPSATDTCGLGQTSGDPHFYGFRGQKYDVMGQSFEVYNIITSPYMQINSRFIPYYKVWDQIVPTGTMMGELGIRLNNHRFRVVANETTAVLDGNLVDMEESWSIPFGNGIVLSNYVKKGNMHEITIETQDLFITFIRKVYTVARLENQWHYDYKAKLITDGNNLHGLLGQSWEEKHFEEKSGTAFQYLDGFEEDYRLKSNNIFGTDFTYNKFVNM